MNLFIDWISKNATLILFDNNRDIIFQKEFKIAWNESSLLLPTLDKFLKENDKDYFDIKNIVVVNWPWSFTWVRTIVLLVNTITYIVNNNITAISYFDLFQNYPIIKTSSKRDCFVQKNKDENVNIIKNEDIEQYLIQNNITNIYWDFVNFNDSNIKTFDKIDYISIIKNKIKKRKANKCFIYKKTKHFLTLIKLCYKLKNLKGEKKLKWSLEDIG